MPLIILRGVVVEGLPRHMQSIKVTCDAPKGPRKTIKINACHDSTGGRTIAARCAGLTGDLVFMLPSPALATLLPAPALR